jgi:hypothetical protein
MQNASNSDTSEAAAQVQLELIRRASVARRLQSCFGFSKSMIALSRATLREGLPELDDLELRLRWVELNYGADLAIAVRAQVSVTPLSANDELLDALGPVVDAFDQLGVAWYVGGSVASGAFGEFRATNDVDVIADLRLEHAEPLVAALGAAYYADLESIRSAIRRRASFNAVHFDSMLKIDVFVLKARAYDQEALRRRLTRRAGTAEDAKSLSVASPEDVVLAKLDWYEQGGSVSERQWNDVQGVLRVQSTAMDLAYLRKWSAELGLNELLARALAEADLG